MGVEVNWLAVVLATLSTMIVGSVWYTPKVFGNKWEKLARIDPKNRASAPKAIGITLVVSLISAYVLAHVSYLSNSFFGHSFLQDALSTAFWVWLGFTAARFITHDAFENRPWKLTLMNVSHELVTFMVMGLIIGLMPPGDTFKDCGRVTPLTTYETICADSIVHGSPDMPDNSLDLLKSQTPTNSQTPQPNQVPSEGQTPPVQPVPQDSPSGPSRAQ